MTNGRGTVERGSSLIASHLSQQISRDLRCFFCCRVFKAHAHEWNLIMWKEKTKRREEKNVARKKVDSWKSTKIRESESLILQNATQKIQSYAMK